MVPLFASLLGILQVISPGPSTGEVLPPGVISPDALAYGVGFGPIKRRRKRWDLVCDMRSDTCSDGRQIATTRSTPVPCETSPGVWEIIPADQGCYSVRGLESWAANTSYLSWGAELDREPWVVMDGSQLSALPEGGYRLCQTGTGSNTGLNQTHSAGLQEGEWATAAVIARPNTASAMLLGTVSGQYVLRQMTGEWWGRYFYAVVYGGSAQRMFIYPRPGGQQLCIDLLGAWVTKSDTPGRPCWGGEAPVTCAADRHTISTEGWPTTEGEICISAEVGADATIKRWLIDGRGPGETGNSRLVVRQGTNVLALLGPQGLVEGGTVTAGQHRLCVHASGNTIRLSVDGVVVAQGDAVAPMAWFPMATIGSAYPTTGGTEIDGSISSIRVRSFE